MCMVPAEIGEVMLWEDPPRRGKDYRDKEKSGKRGQVEGARPSTYLRGGPGCHRELGKWGRGE